mgnify:FL=1
MQVKELIEVLKGFDPEMEVHTSYGYGDYWRTQVAPKVGYIEEAKVEYSEYHRMDKLVEDDDGYAEFEDEEPGNPEENVRRVVIIG